MAGLIYDAGMLVALDRGVQRAWRLHERANVVGGVPVLPVVVLGKLGGEVCSRGWHARPARFVAERGHPISLTQWWSFSR
jgi:hypothetical protein